jgi:hypothetical protein
MRMIAVALLAFVMPSCAKPPRTLPDDRLPHMIAEDTEVSIFTRGPDGKFTTETVKASKGWWIASPRVIDP